MSHWFLVGRDLMWFAIGCFPVFYAVTADPYASPEFRFFTALAMQWIGIFLLYFQVIK